MASQRNGDGRVLVVGYSVVRDDETSATADRHDVDRTAEGTETEGSSPTDDSGMGVTREGTIGRRIVETLESVTACTGVETATTAQEALERLDEHSYACVLTAADLPDATGIDCCERIRAADPMIPIVFRPVEGSEELASAAVTAGATEYVPSGSDSDMLRHCVERAIETAQHDRGESAGRSSAALERELLELRRSEELHRVTLNHMTDTVLITDDAGAFTYVCPNVHFIFGYTDDEIHEMGTIDELLGSDPADREELESAGVVTNVECTATDRDGDEHTLLVNAREVDIQGGTILYSCRDVTKRKQREEALTALHRTARRLLYAETTDEIAEIVIEDAADVLDLEASAVFLFDTDESVLRPAAHSPSMERLCGPPTAFRVNAENAVGYSFLERSSSFLTSVDADDGDGETASTGTAGDTTSMDDGEMDGGDDDDEMDGGDDDEMDGRAAGETRSTQTPATVVRSSLPANPDTDVESAAYVSLGEHGVFVAGSESADRFDDVARELAEVLSATAEAALDRVERESELREQDRELHRQNRRLTRLNLINEIIREIDGALVRAATREEIEDAVCDRLTAEDRFTFAWIGAPTPGGNGGETELELRAWDGAGRDYLDAVSFPLAAGGEPACRTGETGDVTVVSNVANRLHEEEWRSAALARDFQSVISVPLAYDEFTYGVLTVYADRPEAFDEVSRPVLEELGETVASAMGAVERKSALLTASSTRLEFDVRDGGDVFCRLARETGCTITFDGSVRQAVDGTWVFATVENGPVDAVVDAAQDLIAIEDVQVLSDDGEDGGTGATIRIQLSDPFLALRLADHGVVLRRVEATPTGGRVVIDVPTGVDARASVRVVETTFEEVSLVSKGTVEEASARDLRSTLLERLTDRQLEVVQVAYYGGFYESPRERTGEGIAETLDISPAAFYQHNRTVQRTLIETLFDEGGLPATTDGVVER